MFAPNMTPGTFVESENGHDPIESLSSSSALFPPSEAMPIASRRRRAPPGKRLSRGYIPRPPNAFMLFRADFVRQKHVPGSIETNHGSLSKIIGGNLFYSFMLRFFLILSLGNCWRALPLDEKRVWEVKAKHAKAEHKIKYPNYRFCPVHNKNKEKKDKPLPTPENERRCEEVAQLLLEGKKGEQLAEAVRNLDRIRSQTPVRPVTQLQSLRRCSSVPLPHLPHDYFDPCAAISIPSVPFVMPSGPSSPLSHQQRMSIGQQRRPSSAGPAFFHSWVMSGSEFPQFHQEVDVLPEPDPLLLNTFNNFNFQSSHSQHQSQLSSLSVDELLNSLPPHEQTHDTPLGLGPLETLGSQEFFLMYDNTVSTPQVQVHNAIDIPELEMTAQWMASLQNSPSSYSSSAYSESPGPSDEALPLPVFAPRPLHVEHIPNNVMFGVDGTMNTTDSIWPYNELGYQVGDMHCVPDVSCSFPNDDFDFEGLIENKA